MTSSEYPSSWDVGLASPAQRRVIADAEHRCELRFAACCSGTASTTSAALANDPVHHHRAACQPCAAARTGARGW